MVVDSDERAAYRAAAVLSVYADMVMKILAKVAAIVSITTAESSSTLQTLLPQNSPALKL